MLNRNTVDENTFELIQNLQSKEYLQEFILVGGTALSLQIGHRKSVDLDLFSQKEFNSNSLLEKLESDFEFEMDSLETNTLVGSIRGIKVDLITHKYPIISNVIKEDGIIMASLNDIAAMKINAISNNGTRVKDFIDLYQLLNIFQFSDMIRFYEAKYSHRNSFHAIKSINYFDDVSLNDWPDMQNKKMGWDTIKNRLDKECIDYINNLSKKTTNY
jgi:hypothetical protein